jgi:hypothetical protein
MPFYDAQGEKVEFMLVWVKLLRIPIYFWSREVGNAHGKFIEADIPFEDIDFMVVVHILIRVDLREGLNESMML